jgi:hypothetical protein
VLLKVIPINKVVSVAILLLASVLLKVISIPRRVSAPVVLFV